MHILQPKHTKLKQEEVEKMLGDLNISFAQIPKINITDPSLSEGCEISDIIKISRVIDGEKEEYFRVITV